MSDEIKLPELGDGIESGDVVNILVSEGDQVEEDSILLELETEKAVVEFPSPGAGKISRIHVKSGETVKVGQVLFSLESDGNESGNTKIEEKKDAQTEKKHKTTGDEEKKALPDKDMETARDQEKSSTDIKEEDHSSSQAPQKEPLEKSRESESDIPIPAGPATRKLARELGIDLSQVTGTARGGRITVDDVKAYARQRSGSEKSFKSVPSVELPDFSQWGGVDRKPLTSLRKKIAGNLASAWYTVPLVTQFDEADITDLETLRKKNSDFVKEQGGRLTITVFVIKAVLTALKAHPEFNSSVDLERGEIFYKQYYNMGVAVDTPSGLIVPVIRNVDRKSIIQLALELAELSEKARNRKISLDELRGGNISVSNLGGIGGTGFTPLVLPPDVAVVGLSRSRWTPVWKNDRVEPRLVMPFSVSYDHRVIDGAAAARFCRVIAESLENFDHLLLQS